MFVYASNLVIVNTYLVLENKFSIIISIQLTRDFSQYKVSIPLLDIGKIRDTFGLNSSKVLPNMSKSR